MAETAQSLVVRVGCEFAYEAVVPAASVFQVRPDDVEGAVVRETWNSEPATAFHDYRDLYGNRCRRLTIPAGHYAMRYEADVAVSPFPAPVDLNARQVPPEELPDDVLVYTLPSRFCLSDVLASEAWERFGSTPPGWACVQTICDWVHENIRFAYGTSKPHTSALDVLRDGTGVCRDFAHLAITFCRALSIPARYAFGYLPDIGVPPPDAPMDFCAWFEAYVGDRWWTFDPRNNQRRIGHIVVGRGRDALDVAMVTLFGTAQFESMTVWADHVA